MGSDLFKLAFSQIYFDYMMIIPAYIVADFLSGIIHWFGDTYSGYGLEFLFESFIEHHEFPTVMCQRDYFQISFDSYLFYLVVRAMGVRTPFSSFLALFIIHANYFHRECHKLNKTNLFFTFTQKYGLTLPPKLHHVHHTSPFNRYYI